MSYRLIFTGITLLDDNAPQCDSSGDDGNHVSDDVSLLTTIKSRKAKEFIEGYYYDLFGLIVELQNRENKQDSRLRERRQQVRKEFQPLYVPKYSLDSHPRNNVSPPPAPTRPPTLQRHASTGTIINPLRNTTVINNNGNLHKSASKPFVERPVPAGNAYGGATMKKLNEVVEFKANLAPNKKYAKTMLFKADDKMKLEETQKMLEEKEQVTAMAAHFGKALLEKNEELEAEMARLKQKVDEFERRDLELQNDNAHLKMKCDLLKHQVLSSEDYTSRLLAHSEELAEELGLERENTKKAMGPMLTRQRSLIMNINEHETLKSELTHARQNEEELNSKLKKSGKVIRGLEAEVDRLQDLLEELKSGTTDLDALRLKHTSLLQRVKALESELEYVRREQEVYNGAGIPRKVAESALELLLSKYGLRATRQPDDVIINQADNCLSELRQLVNKGEESSPLAWILLSRLNSTGAKINYSTSTPREEQTGETLPTVAIYLVIAIIALQLVDHSSEQNEQPAYLQLKQKLDETEKALRQLTSEHKETTDKLSSMQNELIDLRSSKKIAEEEKNALLAQHSNLQAQIHDLEDMRVEKEKFKAELESLNLQLSTLHSEKVKAEEALQATTSSLTSQLESMTIEYSNLQTQKTTMEVKWHEEGFKLGTEIKTLTYEISELRTEQENMRKSTALAHDNHTEEILALNMEISKLKIEKSTAENMETSLRSLNAQLTAEIAKLRAKLKEAQNVYSENAKLSQELANATSEINQLRADKENMEKTIQALKNELASSTSATSSSTSQNHVVQRIAAPEPRDKDYANEEEEPLLRYINVKLRNDPHLWHVLPADPSAHIIHAVYDGVLLCKLVNFAAPGTLDERVVNLIPTTSIDVEQNFNLCLNSARAIGCRVATASRTQLTETEDFLTLVYEIVKVEVFAHISLTSHPEFLRLRDSRESVVQIANLPPLELLQRWISHHLNSAVSIDASTKAMHISEIAKLLHVLCPEILLYEEESEAGSWVVATAKNLGIEVLCDAKGALLQKPRVQALFLAQIAHTTPGLAPLSESELAAVQSALDESTHGDPEGTREERSFCTWINSLGIGSHVTNLQKDMRDGLVMLRILDKLHPGLVIWRDVNMNPNNPYKMLENCNASLAVGKKINFSLVGIAGKDLFDGNRKLTLAFVWQACKHHLLSVLRECGGLRSSRGEFTENDVLAWTKGRLQTSSRTPITSFRDPSFRTAHPLIDVLSAIVPGVVQWRNVIEEPRTDTECLMNARYAVGLARKIGCFVFCVPEDICEIKPKMIISFLASVMWYDITSQKSKIRVAN